MKKLVNYNVKNSFNRRMGAKFPPSFPNEMLVKILSSNFYSNIKKNFFNKRLKILEVGSSSGNNLRFFLEKKYTSYGIEINKEMVDLGKKNLLRLGYKIPKILIGNNCNIPFKNNSFDCLVSINTIHYNYGDDILLALKEFKRVLKKNGVVIIETSGPEHFNRAQSKKIKNLEWIWNSKDFRKGEKFGFFDDKISFSNTLKKVFSKVDVFERTEFSKVKLHFYFAVCTI